jgi:hypothetical protein
MDFHVVVRTATWHFSIGPRTDQKMPKMSDTWQPLVFIHIIMTHVSLYMCHVPYMDADVICTDVDVSSTDADSSLLTGLG